MLEGFDYRTTVFHSGSSLKQVFAIYGDVLHVDADGMVLNDGDAQYRVAQWLRAGCDPSYRVEPPLPRRHRRRRGPQAPDPLTKDTVRIDLDTAAAEAGVPANAPDYARTFEDARPARRPRAPSRSGLSGTRRPRWTSPVSKPWWARSAHANGSSPAG
ncbi:hypothetical protein ABZZ44_17895 [Streptomyces sp. NPDC006460]|uniref:DUF7677 family protein n=1 Tax=Streptomyces sp. NPDC006460 TaxID=3154304 RepID=UPI0033B5E684